MKTSRPYVTLDFETASACDLKACGAYVYAQHPTTEILVVGYSVGGANPTYLLPEDCVIPAYADDWTHGAGITLWHMVLDPKVIFVAHNCGFERNIWTQIMVGVYGWPDIPLERWHDTQAVALMKGLPAGLDKLGRIMKLQTQKDTEGRAFTLSLSKFRAATKANKLNGTAGTLDRSPEAYQRAGVYCVQDVREEDELLGRLNGGFEGNERAVWELDQRINDRGILLDRQYIQSGINIINSIVPEVRRDFETLTGIPKPSQGKKLLEWLKANGAAIENLQKATVEKLLANADAQVEDWEPEEALSDQDDDLEPEIILPDHCAEALRLRAKISSASVKKLPRMLAVMGEDGRARGLVQYHGAGTGRWSGRLLQPHNFPRSLGFQHNVEDLVAAIKREDVPYIRSVYGDPINAISGGLRHALIAKAGTSFHLGDYTQIEARVILALAGAEKGLAAFLGGKPYIEMAESIYKRKVDKRENVQEYTIGKNTILGCGFQMGALTFRRRYCPNETPEFAERAIKTYRVDFAPEVPKVWYALERAALEAVWENKVTEAYGVQFRLEGEWLTARLPSGRKLWYYAPMKERSNRPGFEDKPVWTSLCVKGGKLIRRQMYGGLITENVVQALARDLLVEAMFRCVAAGLTIVLTVHDEIVVEGPDESYKTLEQCMKERSAWAAAMNVPINIEGMSSPMYRK